MAEPTRGAVRPPTPFAVYRTAQVVPGLLFRAFHDMSMVGTENIPTKGPAVLMANHESYLDPLLVIQLTVRPIVFAAKTELFDLWNGWLFPRLNCLPVRRGKADLTLFRAASRQLRRGRLMGLFPEGTRSADGELQPAQHGALAIAIWSGVPIIPIGLAGTHSVLPRQGGYTPLPVGIEAGQPLLFPQVWRHGKPDKAAMDAVGRRIMAEIAHLKARVKSRLGVTD